MRYTIVQTSPLKERFWEQRCDLSYGFDLGVLVESARRREAEEREPIAHGLARQAVVGGGSAMSRRRLLQLLKLGTSS